MSWRTDYDSGKKVYVGPYLEPGLSSEELRDYFCKYGRIEAVWVARNPAGFAFVTFEDARDAEEACLQLNGTEFGGKRIRVEVARGPRNSNRGPMSDHSSRNNYSPAYRRSPSYGRDSPNNYYHEKRYRASPSDRDRRSYDSRMNYSDRNRRDSYGRRSGGNYSSRQHDVENRRSMTHRRYQGRRRDSVSHPKNERSSERHCHRSRSRRSLSRNTSSNSGNKKSYSRSEHLPNESRETSRHHTYIKSPQQSNSSFSCDENTKGKYTSNSEGKEEPCTTSSQAYTEERLN